MGFPQSDPGRLVSDLSAAPRRPVLEIDKHKWQRPQRPSQAPVRREVPAGPLPWNKRWDDCVRRKIPWTGLFGCQRRRASSTKDRFSLCTGHGVLWEAAADDAGEVNGNLQVYSYLDGRIKHFKHIGVTHGDTLGNAQIKNEIRWPFLVVFENC